jgi:hypothetical protein
MGVGLPLVCQRKAGHAQVCGGAWYTFLLAGCGGTTVCAVSAMAMTGMEHLPLLLSVPTPDICLRRAHGVWLLLQHV